MILPKEFPYSNKTTHECASKWSRETRRIGKNVQGCTGNGALASSFRRDYTHILPVLRRKLTSKWIFTFSILDIESLPQTNTSSNDSGHSSGFSKSHQRWTVFLPSFLPQLLVFLRQFILSITNRIVNTPLLHLVVSTLPWLDEFIWRPACLLLESIKFTSDCFRTFCRKPVNLASLAQLLYLLVLVPRKMINTVPLRKIGVLGCMRRHIVEATTQTVNVLGLNVHSVHAIIDSIGSPNPIKGGGRSTTIQRIPSTANGNGNLFCNLAMLGIRITENALGRSHKITDALHFPQGIQKMSILSV